MEPVPHSDDVPVPVPHEEHRQEDHIESDSECEEGAVCMDVPSLDHAPKPWTPDELNDLGISNLSFKLDVLEQNEVQIRDQRSRFRQDHILCCEKKSRSWKMTPSVSFHKFCHCFNAERLLALISYCTLPQVFQALISLNIIF